MSKKLRRISIVKVFAISAAVLCIVSMSSAMARELRVNNTKCSQISDENAAKLKEQALLAFENASRKIAESGLSEADIAGYEKTLPQNLMKRLYAVIEVSQNECKPGGKG